MASGSTTMPHGTAICMPAVPEQTGSLRIAFVAHDDHKQALLRTIADHRDFLRGHRLYATSGTGRTLQETYGLDFISVGHGPAGGDVRLAHLVLDGEVDIVIFLRSCAMVQGHEDDIRMLVRVCHMSDCILATNFATAELVLDALAAGLPVVPAQRIDVGSGCQ